MRRRYVYLGRRVRDVNKPGLDSLSEVKGIAGAIISDYKRGKISYKKAMSRMNLLELVVVKSKKLKDKKKAREIVDAARVKLQKMRK